jgi:hypothetical protein
VQQVTTLQTQLHVHYVLLVSHQLLEATHLIHVLLVLRDSIGMEHLAICACLGHIKQSQVSSAPHALTVQLVDSALDLVQQYYVQAQYLVQQATMLLLELQTQITQIQLHAKCVLLGFHLHQEASFSPRVFLQRALLLLGSFGMERRAILALLDNS